MVSLSRLDRAYRRLVLGTFFADGWGDPRTLDLLYANRAWFTNRERLLEKTEPHIANHKIAFGPAARTRDRLCDVANGTFEAPMNRVLPDLVPPCIRTATVQFVGPAGPPSPTGGSRPLVVHLAGTGDHGFWRRRQWLARPLAAEYGVTSLILENPYYGTRKPKEQMRSCLRRVTDLYIMGACLILECLVLLRWAEQHGYWPLGLTGISMGGYMACLAAASYPAPVSLVPCLSWSTAAVVFTRGVLAGTIPWGRLARDLDRPEYRDFLKPDYAGLEEMRGDFIGATGIMGLPSSISAQNEIWDPQRAKFESLKSETGEITSSEVTQSTTTIPQNETPNDKLRISAPYTQTHPAKRAMDALMDDFTYIGNYTAPVQPCKLTHVTATHDAYVPGPLYAPSVTGLWGGDTRTLDGGHIASYLMQQGAFKEAIAGSLGALKHAVGRKGDKQDFVVQ